MDVYEAMAWLVRPLMRQMGYEATAATLDGICELRTRREMEEAVCWLAHDHGLLNVISDQAEVSVKQSRASLVA